MNKLSTANKCVRQGVQYEAVLVWEKVDDKQG